MIGLRNPSRNRFLYAFALALLLEEFPHGFEVGHRQAEFGPDAHEFVVVAGEAALASAGDACVLGGGEVDGFPAGALALEPPGGFDDIHGA